MLISLFPTPFDHFHFHPTLGLDPALILTQRHKTVKDTQASDEANNPFSKSLMEDSKHFTGNALYTIAQKEHAQHPTHPGII